LIVDEQKAYVTDLMEPSVAILDLTSYTVSGSIPTGKSTEAIAMAGDKVFVSNWSNFFVTAPNNTVQVIDPNTDQLIDSIVVTREPNSIVVDAEGMLWVLCSGGYLGEEDPALVKIDPSNLDILKEYTFLNEMDYPVELIAAPVGNTLYWLNGGIYTMPTDAVSLPQQALAEAIGASYSCLGINNSGNNIYAGDPLDYQQNGIIYIFNNNGNLLGEFEAGIIPGFIIYY
jgi:DNA-binding beta-propeller fold protein YncE